MSAVLTAVLPEIRRVGVIDDDPAQAEFTSLLVEEADLEPIVIRSDHPFQRHEELAAELVRSEVQAAICDHRLTHHNFSRFNGASFVASLYDSRAFPSILITTYVDMDVDVSIRKWRHKIPVLLNRDGADPESIKLGLVYSSNELQGRVSTSRKPHRSLIRVTDIGDESGEVVLDVIIPSWNTLRAVRFPRSLIPEAIRELVTQGTRLLASVNIGAEDAQELYFDEFELAPEPDPANGLA